MEKQAAFSDTMAKGINTIEQGAGEGLSKSVGRLMFPFYLPLYQDKALKDFSDMDPREVKTILNKFKKKFPGDLDDIAIRTKAARPLDDFVRTLRNKKVGLPFRVLGAPLSAIESASSWLSRGSHYNPLADSTTVYGDFPEVLAHELGHAVDMNEKAKMREGKRSSLKRDAYLAGMVSSGMLGAAHLEGLHPMTLWTESMANRRAADALGDESFKKARNILWPAFSTYLTAAGLAGLKIHDKYFYTGPKRDSLYEKYKSFLNNFLPESMHDTNLGVAVRGLMTIVPPAATARVLAHIVSNRKTREKKATERQNKIREHLQQLAMKEQQKAKEGEKETDPPYDSA